MSACTFRDAVDAHFDGGLPPAEEHELRLHLPTCEACTRRYERHLILEAVTPDALGPKARLRRGLPLPAPEAATPAVTPLRRWIGPAAGVLALAACLLLFLRRPPQDNAGFHARGQEIGSTKAAAPELEIYRLVDGGGRVVEGAVGRGDELAFAYKNPSGKKRILVFGVDEHRHVYWYHPAWTRPEDTPLAVTIRPASELVELEEGIAHDLDGRSLRIYALFTDEALTVKDVEATVAARPVLAPALDIPNAVEVSRLLEVR